jgi:hypothetical protein
MGYCCTLFASDTLQQLTSTVTARLKCSFTCHIHLATATLPQVLAAYQEGRPVNTPFTVLPLSSAAKGIVMPQPNRYAPVCPPGSYQNPDQFLPCIPCPQGQFQVGSTGVM